MSQEMNTLTDRGDLREKLVATAVKFLTNPDVLRLTHGNKENFLRSKGLTDAEISAAVSKASELLNFHSFSSDLMIYQNRRSSWFRDNVLPVVVYGGFAYGVYWFYKNWLRHLLFVEKPKTKTIEQCLGEVKQTLDSLSDSIDGLRRDVAEVGAAQHRSGGVRAQIDTVKSELASVKGILLNRSQFPSLKTRSSPPSIPAWQRQSEAPPPAPGEPAPAPRARRSESGGSNSSEGEQATKNSDSSLEIIT